MHVLSDMSCRMMAFDVTRREDDEKQKDAGVLNSGGRAD